MLTSADYLIVGFYLAFILALGVVFRRFSRNTNDYFRGAGSMLWWLSGASAMTSALSAWIFTGAAGAVYETGTLVAVLYASNIIGITLTYFFCCRRFRRMRVFTSSEAVRRRYGAATEQLYVWSSLPFSLVFAGIRLSAVGALMSAVFQTPELATILTIGAVVIFIALLGGAWGVVGGDFLQLMLILLVLVLASFFTLRLPEIGGLSGLLAKAPRAHFDWSLLMRPKIIVLWCLATFISQCSGFTSLTEGGSRFLMVKDDVNARRSALAMLVYMAAIMVLILIPPMAAAIVIPDLASQFPMNMRPHEAAFVAICFRALPPGLIGLLVVGIFASAMASMDSVLNLNAGIFVRSFYRTVVRPRASERELLLAAKVCTLVLGLLVMAVAKTFSMWRTLDLFDLLQATSAVLSFPVVMPMVLGMFVRKAPPWAGWSTMAVGMATAWAGRWLGIGGALGAALGAQALNGREQTCLGFAASILTVLLVECAWFAGVTLLSRRPEAEHVARLFEDFERPVDSAAENPASDDPRQYRVMGRLCLAYGAGICATSLVTGEAAGKASLLFCGGVIALVGATLALLGRGSRA